MNPLRILKILSFTFVIAVAGRFAVMAVEKINQNSLTDELCHLISLPLETGLLRETHEGLESALKKRGEPGACVSVTDNGRSYSPDCYQSGKDYRTVLCKAEGNTGVRAAISFESRSLIGMGLLYGWLALSISVIALIVLANGLSQYVVGVYSWEVSALLFDKKQDAIGDDSWLHRMARFTMNKVGISASLSERAESIRTQLLDFESKIEREAATRARLEQEAISSQDYAEKVNLIRHDIRSPLSSLQAIYERLKSDDSQTTKALATAIRRIQLLMDDLNQVGRVGETPKLVIAEVAVEEIVLVLADKFRSAKSASLSVDYDSDSLSPITVGEREFQGVIENLLENALDAVSVNGRVSLSIENQFGICKIMVEDDGCGVSEENLPRLFTQGGSFGKVNGLGLGLFNTKRSVESWRGTIECTRLPRGARFTVSIPLMQTGVVFSGLPASPQVKVIDDDHQVAVALSRAGYEVLEAVDTFRKGERVLADGTSDAFSVLVDLRLDGNNLGTDLIAGQPGRKRVFLCTNDFDDLTVVKLAREIGVKIIPKPMCFFEQYRAQNTH